MWLLLRNTFTRGQVISTETSREAHPESKSALGVAASAALLSGAIALLGAPASDAVLESHSRADRGIAVKADLLDASDPSLYYAPRFLSVETAMASLMHTASHGWTTLPSADRDQAVPSPSAGTSYGSMPATCRINPSVCGSPVLAAAAASDAHAWAGRVAMTSVSASVVAVTAAAGTASASDAAVSVSHALAAAAFVMGDAGSGSYAGQIGDGRPGALVPLGLPSDLSAQLTRIFAGRLNVNTPARPGDSYRVVYERAGSGAAQGRRITAVNLRLAGRTYQAVWFVAPGRTTGNYYSFDGQRLAAERFSMPLNFVRVSSPFGYRIHPVTGVRLLHTGVDLTAAPGTPVVAASAGTVQFIGADSGYGKHVVLRHAQGYTTYYGHLSAFAVGLRVGARVAEGQRVGAVGETGVTTGPHLHFEVRLNNQPTDPLRLTSHTLAASLTGAQRVAFDRVATTARNQLAALSGSGDTRTASNTSPDTSLASF